MITEPVPVSPHDTPKPTDHTNPRELLEMIMAEPEQVTPLGPELVRQITLMLTDPGPPPPAAPGSGPLSARERELVILVARGRTNAEIAAQLYISVRTVGSHLDRIRDKTGCRRRADLTRLALTMGLV
jgi:DNA-binding CsgD family transcriptional regulator